MMMSENPGDKRLSGSLALSLLYEFTRDLALAGEMDAVLQTVITHFGHAFGRPVAVLLWDSAGTPKLAAAVPESVLSEEEWQAAARLLGQARLSGADAGLRLRRSLWQPMRTPRGVVGLLGLAASDRSVRGRAGSPTYSRLTTGRRRLLEVFAGSAALAIERAQLAAHAQQIQVLEATEKLQTALLHAISHDLRTPLLAITVAFSNLELADQRLDEATRRALARTGRQEAERLNRLVGNLLDISRIEAGALKLVLEPSDVEEVIGAALDRLAPEDEEEERPASMGSVDERSVAVEAPIELAPVPMDMPLIVQALANVLDNAVKYSPLGFSD